MSLYKKTASVILALIMIFALTSCGKAGNNATVYFELLDAPANLDPQTAYSDSELLIVRNLFEGLLRKNGSGEIVEAACKSYEKSGLTYTFEIRDGLKWSNGTSLKAEDFVFGIRRALDKDTEAPFASRLFAIKNAKKVYSGEMSATSLGISGKGKKLVIKLEYDDPYFLESLTTSVAMPCNEKFFSEAEGKYCQDAHFMICNGSYDIFKWNKEDFGIRLYKNKEYKGVFEASNGAVFFSLVDDLAQVERLNKNESDMALMPSIEVDEARTHGINTVAVENICWFLTIGDEYDYTVKEALLKSFSKNIYKDSLKYGLRAADSIYPGVLDIAGTEGVGMPEYDLETAKSIFSSVIKYSENEKFPTSTVYYYDKEEIKDPLTSIVGHWQQNLCAFVNIKPATSLVALQNELSSRTLQFAFFPVTAHGVSLSEYLNCFSLSGSAVSAQKNLLSNKNIVPVCFESTNIGYSDSISNVFIDTGNGYIDFAFICKKE